MHKPKFKMSKTEMLAFNDACEDAIFQCPQVRYGYFEDRDILRGEITAKELLRTWLSCGTLFSLGYAELLTEEAVDVFRAYKQYRAEKRIWKEKINENH